MCRLREDCGFATSALDPVRHVLKRFGEESCLDVVTLAWGIGWVGEWQRQ
jgi:hypothetical protein